MRMYHPCLFLSASSQATQLILTSEKLGPCWNMCRYVAGGCGWNDPPLDQWEDVLRTLSWYRFVREEAENPWHGGQKSQRPLSDSYQHSRRFSLSEIQECGGLTTNNTGIVFTTLSAG